MLKNYQQTKVSAPPNLQRADRLRPAPGRPDHPDRASRRRAPAQPGDGHDDGDRQLRRPGAAADACGSTPTPRTACTARRSTTTSRPTSGCTSTTRRRRSPTSSYSDGTIVTQTDARTRRCRTARPASPSGVGSVHRLLPALALQVRRRRAGDPAHLDLATEQQILRVPNNRQECCHVAGDIDFDKNNNLWLVTGDDTPAGGINAGGYGPFNDQLTDEQQTVRANNATGGTFTLTFNGQTTAPIAVQRDRGGRSTRRSRRCRTSAPTTSRPPAARRTRRTSTCSSGARCEETDADHAHQQRRPALTGATADGDDGRRSRSRGRLVPAARPATTARSTLNTNDLRGKILRIKVKDTDITAADANKADLRRRAGAYTIPAGNLFPLVGGAPQAKTRAEVYSMGFRNPFRIQVDENDVAYITDYSPDAQHAGAQPRAVRRRPLRDRPQAVQLRLSALLLEQARLLQLELPASAAGARRTVGTRGTRRRSRSTAAPPPVPNNDSRWNAQRRPGQRARPARAAAGHRSGHLVLLQRQPRGQPARHAVLRLLRDDSGADRARARRPSARGCSRSSTRAASAPHGATKYNYDPANPNTKKFPPYYDDSVILGEFTQDTMREVKLDSQNRVFKINSFLDCGAANAAEPDVHVRVRQPDGHAVREPTARSTC